MKKTILTLFALSLAAATPHLVHGLMGETYGRPQYPSESAMPTGQDREFKKDMDPNQDPRHAQPAEDRAVIKF